MYKIVLFFVAIILFSCKAPAEELNTIDFEYSFMNANTVKFQSKVTGKYDVIIWNIDGITIGETDTITHHFNYKGDHVVVLQLWNGKKYLSAKKTIQIEQDDANIQPDWVEEFDSNSLNSSIWTVETGVHVNNELQVYSSAGNYNISNGVLTIICKKVNDNGAYGSYTSARLKTEGKKMFKYGRLEARLQLPKGKGTWPAFWMLGENINTVSWPKCGEIDIMENVGCNPLWIHGTLHSQNNYGTNGRGGKTQLSTVSDEAEWHVYGVNWDSQKISFYIDDYTKPYATIYAPTQKPSDNWPFDSNFFIILNLAFGGDWGGYQGIDKTLDNMEYKIDWVRYYGN